MTGKKSEQSLTVAQPIEQNPPSDLEGVFMEWTAFEDKRNPGDWRVEAIDFENEGAVYVAIFSGPDARERAEEYAAWQNAEDRRLSRRAS